MSGLIRGIVVCLIFPIAIGAAPVWASSGARIDAMSDQIRAGIEQVVTVVTPKYDASVESYLRNYLERNKERTEMMLGRSELYFPMFEAELTAAGLPADLKYLAVVESALTPHAVSPVGAMGLWQFMRPTARECGLQVTKYVDERCDPLKSTKAAVQYLRMLYEQFDSWELAMAAYNSGPGRVRYAIRRSGSKDFWKLQRYLPRETRSYVPGFIAASYVLNYYQDHGLAPSYRESQLTETATITVRQGLSFSEIATVTQVPYELVSELNPVYVRKFIPQSELGHPLVLPATAAMTMQAYLANDAAPLVSTEFEGIETGIEYTYVERLVEETYIVESGDNLYQIARENGCSVDDLKSWNRLSGSMIHIGQRLKIKKMAMVLIKAPTATVPLRPEMEVSLLPSALTTALSADGRSLDHLTQIPVEPVFHTRQVPPVEHAVILRRRMSVQPNGIQFDGNALALTPGTRLK